MGHINMNDNPWGARPFTDEEGEAFERLLQETTESLFPAMIEREFHFPLTVEIFDAYGDLMISQLLQEEVVGDKDSPIVQCILIPPREGVPCTFPLTLVITDPAGKSAEAGIDSVEQEKTA